MKTAISLPDDVFERVTRTANDLGMSRSELFSRAAQRYMDELDAQSLTRLIDESLDLLDGPDDSEIAAVAAGRKTLATDEEW